MDPLCLEVFGGGVACSQRDAWLSWLERRDAAPQLSLLNAFLAVQFSLVALVPAASRRRRVLETLFTALPILAGLLTYASLVEASVVGSVALGTPAIALRGGWGDSEPLLFTPLLSLAGIVCGLAHARWVRAPALFVLGDELSLWRNARGAVQTALLVATSFYVAHGAEAALMLASVPVRWLRPEWRAYAAARTLVLATLYVWNRADDKNRVLVYGDAVRTYDGVWLRLFAVYAVHLACSACMWAPAWQLAILQAAASVLASWLVRAR